MPLFDYRCNRCGQVTEVFVRHPGDEHSAVPCAECGSADVTRLVSRFSFKPIRAEKYSEALREKTLPFLKSRPGADEFFAAGGGSEESKAFELTERIGQRVDAALDQHVLRQL